MLSLVALSAAFVRPGSVGSSHARVAIAPRGRAVVSSSSAFDELRTLEAKLERLEVVGQKGLRSFYDDDTGCFALTPGVSRVSVTSTVFSLLAIDASPQAWREDGASLVRGCLEALLEADCRADDVFQAVLVVAALRVIDPAAIVIRESDALVTRTETFATNT